MKDEYIKAVPKSSPGKVLGYSIERWEKLSRYTDDGILNIDNSPVENKPTLRSRWLSGGEKLFVCW